MEKKRKEDVVIVLDLDTLDGGCGVYPSLEIALLFIEDWHTFQSNEDQDAKIKVDVTITEIREGWVVKCDQRSYKVVRSTLRN